MNGTRSKNYTLNKISYGNYEQQKKKQTNTCGSISPAFPVVPLVAPSPPPVTAATVFNLFGARSPSPLSPAPTVHFIRTRKRERESKLKEEKRWRWREFV